MKNFLTTALLFITWSLAIGQLPTSVIPEPYCSGLNQPTEITHANDERLFICEKEGAIKIINASGVLIENPFLDITSQVETVAERGLLGLAFHPNYEENGYFYIFHTGLEWNNNVTRYTVSADDPNVADPNSAKLIYTIENTQGWSYHHGGCLKFGPDGYLYIAAGDLFRDDEAQSLSSVRGSILRIDVDQGDPYAIPDTNPFVNETDALGEILISGLRNPWKISFDRTTGDLWIADVGLNTYEEINRIAASEFSDGLNLGWPCYEGPIFTEGWGCTDLTPSFTDPVGGYPYINKPYDAFNMFSKGCGGSITGGYVYRGAHTELANLGVYISSDYCTGQINATYIENGNYKTEEIFRNTEMLKFVSTLGEDIDGELYAADVRNGIVYHLDFNCQLPTYKVSVATCPDSEDGCIEINIPDDEGIMNVIIQDSMGTVIPEESYCALGFGKHKMIINNVSSDCTKEISFLVAYLEPDISATRASCSIIQDGTVDISFDQNVPEEYNSYLVNSDNMQVDTADYDNLATGQYSIVLENPDGTCMNQYDFRIVYNFNSFRIDIENDSIFIEQDTFVSYQWLKYITNNLGITGADTIVGATKPYYIAQSSGLYGLNAVEQDGCIAKSFSPQEVVLTYVDYIETFPDFKFYPSPTSEVLTVELERRGTQELVATIYDLMGTVILDRNLGTQSLRHDINVTDLHQGCYFLEISDGKRTQVEKFFKN